MDDITRANTPLDSLSGVDTVILFKQLLACHGLSYFITSSWEGWRRHGRIGITERAEWFELKPTLEAEEFARSSSSWGAADQKVGRIRTGSPKHRAIVALIEKITLRFGPSGRDNPSSDESK
ncbi:MAG: hypothetical protein JWR22_2832 [Herminiimonas sp.]|nr:hypothetical protein [Herminiimonas sp.]